MSKYIICIILLMSAISGAPAAHAVDLRLSFKMFTDANRQPPQEGEFRTEEQINYHIDQINRIFAANNSEIRFVKDTDIVLLTSADAGEQAEIAFHFNAACCLASPHAYEDLDKDIVNNPGLYQWRDDAINIYIFSDLTGFAGTRYPNCCFYEDGTPRQEKYFAIFPQNSLNDNTFAHEVGGHWLGYFGDDGVYPNLMDNTDVGEELTAAQLEALSNNAYRDKRVLYVKDPIYISWGRGSINGDRSWNNKYETLGQEALDNCESNNGVIVMESGTYVVDQPISNNNITIESRLGNVILSGQ